MYKHERPDFLAIISDNENAAAQAIADQHFVQAFLLVHSLMESLLRFFLRAAEDDVTFNQLIHRYEDYLKKHHYPFPTFAKELTQFNRRRNRIVHQLWEKGYSHTNKHAEPAAHAAVTLYSLFIEWLETFDPEITETGFQYDQPEV
jgi:hypothetical protein